MDARRRFAILPIITAIVQTTRINPDHDCCFGTGPPVAFWMLGTSLVAMVLFVAGVAAIRRADGGKLARGNVWRLWAIGLLVYAVMPVAVGLYVEANY